MLQASGFFPKASYVLVFHLFFFFQFQRAALKHLLTGKSRISPFHQNNAKLSLRSNCILTAFTFSGFFTFALVNIQNPRAVELHTFPYILCVFPSGMRARGIWPRSNWIKTMETQRVWQCHKQIKLLCVYHFIQSRWVVLPMLQSSSCINTKPWMIFL